MPSVVKRKPYGQCEAKTMEDTVFAGEWWHFDAYELRHGYIRPKRNATLKRSSPFADFQEARNGRKEEDAPYTKLIRLADNLCFDLNGRLTPESARAILEWCSTFGLLGLLLHQVQEARFAPRWERAHRSSPEPEIRQFLRGLSHTPGPNGWPGINLDPRPGDGDLLYLTQRFYRRRSSASFLFGDAQLLQAVLRDRPDQIGQVALERDWAVAPPRATVRNLATEEWGDESLADTWARFFPNVPEMDRVSYQYPKPYSDEFWAIYAEPLNDFIAATRLLREAFLSAAALTKNSGDLTNPTTQPGASHLNALVGMTGGPALFHSKQGPVQQVVSSSLFGTLAIMAQMDLASARRIFRCRNEKCRNLVVAFGYQTSYCSAQCRYATLKRAQRQNTAKRPGRPRQKRRRRSRNAQQSGRSRGE